MRIAFIGCGYVADYYQQTLVNHPILQLAGVYDRDPERSRRFTGHYKVKRYGSFEEVLNDASVEVVVNLTTPKSHYDITKAALEAGKQVYTEKPISLRIDQARELVELAEQRGLILSAAPCGVGPKLLCSRVSGRENDAHSRARKFPANQNSDLRGAN